MVHFDDFGLAGLPPLPRCPKCGSHETEVITRLDDYRTAVWRCNACGATFTLLDPDLSTPRVISRPAAPIACASESD